MTLGLEVLLTRVFSVILFASHSFLAISLALFGTGSGALLAYFAKPLGREELRRRQILLLAGFSAALVLSLWVLLQIEFVPQRMEDPNTRLARENLSFVQRSAMLLRNPELFKSSRLYGAIPIAFFPFFLAGYLQAMIFRSSPGRFGMMYGIDLLGATFGSIVIPLLLFPLGLKGTVCALTALTMAPAAFALGTGEKRLWIAAAGGAPFLIAVVLGAGGSFQVRYAAGFAEKDLIREHWSPMSRVALMHYRGQEMYVIDNSSRSYYAPKNEDTVRRYLPSLYTIPFELRQGGDLLVIASGGGQELALGSHFGMKRIDAVEIARPMVLDILHNKKDDPGNPYLLPNVHWHIADGRSVVMRSRHRYDLIEMLDVNFATLAGQISLAWSPNFVSTQEAFSEYLEHLKEDGFLCYTLFSYGESPLRGEKVRRLVSLVAGMKAAGIARPEDHLVILSRPLPYGYHTMFLAKKSPLKKEELIDIHRVAASRNAGIEIFYPELPDLPGSGIPRTYLQGVAGICRGTRPMGGLLGALKSANRWNIPLSDDRPYLVGSGFFAQGSTYEELIGALYRPLLAVMGILAFFFVILPFVVRRPGGGEKVRMEPRLLLILSLTGIGFMFIEMAGIYKYQLYLHHPTLAMVVVLSSMILGAGLGSLHSGTIPDSRKEKKIALSSGGAVLVSILLFHLVPIWGHRVLLWLPMTFLLPLVFAAFAGLGFLLGHVVPLSIDGYGHKQAQLLPWCWAITVTGSVVGTVLASLLARDFGMSLISALGILCYFSIMIVSSVHRITAPAAPEVNQTAVPK